MPQTHTHELVFTDTEVRKRYVSWERGEAEREWACLVALAEHAPGVAPRPVRREDEAGAPVVVMERIPGTPLTPAPLTTQQTRALGAALRAMYAVPPTALTTVPDRVLPPHELAAALPGWLAGEHDLGACQDAALVAEAVAAARSWVSDPRHLPSHGPRVLGIADLNPANVLWDGEVCRLVDFEDGGATDAAYDLADHVEHIAARLPGVHDARALADAVGLDDEARARMEAYRPWWAVFWLVMLLPGNGGFRRNPPGTTEDQARHVLGWLGGEITADLAT